MGQGLGGLVSILLHKEAKIKVSGMILVAPALKRPGSKIMSALSGFALNLLPNKKGLFNFNFDIHSKNPNVSKYLQEDPLVYHDKMMVGSLMQMA